MMDPNGLFWTVILTQCGLSLLTQLWMTIRSGCSLKLSFVFILLMLNFVQGCEYTSTSQSVHASRFIFCCCCFVYLNKCSTKPFFLSSVQVLTLASNERISLSSSMRLLFEISHLKAATPATVSRAGILCVNPQDLGWTS